MDILGISIKLEHTFNGQMGLLLINFKIMYFISFRTIMLFISAQMLITIMNNYKEKLRISMQYLEKMFTSQIKLTLRAFIISLTKILKLVSSTKKTLLSMTLILN